jgi:hypothetical protein
MSTTVIADVLQPSPNNGTIVISHNLTVSGNLTVVGTATEITKAVSYLKAALPAVSPAGQEIYVSDATNTVGTGAIAYSNGTNWINVTTGVAVV